MTTLALLFAAATTTYHLPPGLLSALCHVESTHRINAVHHDDGRSDSLGVCQIKLETAKWLGFKGTREQLMKPEVNIKYAAIYLNRQLVRYSGDTPKAVASYNTGSFKPGATHFAVNQPYVDKVFKTWALRK